jgi:hypothetical protein
MIERLAPTGSGLPTVYVGEQALHSRYNPAGEAEKYIDALTLREGLLFLILIEPGLGYIIPLLRKRFPEVSIISLHVSDFFTDPDLPVSGGLKPDAAWSPGMGVALGRFLEERIPDIEAAAVGLVEWRPSLAAYGEGYLRLLSETVEFIKRSDANKRTLRGFGRRWFKNVFRNIRLLKRILRYESGTLPLIVTGAGPSLEESLPLIREGKKRGNLFVLAVSSSVPALLAGGLAPDLVLSTDGGGWALFHLYETLRAMPDCGFAAALTAALPSQCGDIPWLPISDGTAWQNLVLRGLGIPFAVLSQRGTVAATALDLALRLTGGRVFITGMDLAHRDIRSHARPYGLERFLEEGSSRFRPVYSQTYVRAKAIEESGSHGIYAAWFNRQKAAYGGRLFSLGNNHAVFNSPNNPAPALVDAAPALSEAAPTLAEAAGLPAALAGIGKAVTERATENPVETASGLLIAALNAPHAALKRELSELLFPDNPQAPAEDLIAEIRLLTEPYEEEAVYG